MACVGFDCGGRFSVVARVHSRGLTTALNEASKRKSGSLVSIKGKQRFIGCNAEPVARSNYKNTVWYATRLLGRKFADPSVQEEIALMPYSEIFSESKEDGTVLVTLSYDGEKRTFTCAQCYAMLLGELKRVAINDAPEGVQNCDVVVTVPSWYDDRQRREVRNACAIAQVGQLGIINDATACGLIWGIWKNKKKQFDNVPVGAAGKEKDDNVAAATATAHVGPCNVMFIDLGDSQMSCTIARYQKDQMQILTTTHDKMLGGRLIDMEIAKFAAESFKGGDVFSNPKALIKLLAAAEKAKKTLSGGITKTKVYCECLMNDRDLNVSLTKEKLVEILTPLLERFAVPIKRALSETGLTGSDFYAIEIVGGSMRIPAFKIAAAKSLGVFKDDATVNYGLANTLDMEEAAAHGAAMKCALLSPKFRIQTTFDIVDAQSYPIKVSWDGAPPVLGDAPPLPSTAEDDMLVDDAAAALDKADVKQMPTLTGGQSAILYDRNAKCGAGRSGERKLHFQRSAAFALEASYHGEGGPSGESSLAKITVNAPPDAVTKNVTSPPWITVSLQQDSNGLLQVNTASAIEAYIEEKTVKQPKKTTTAKTAEAKVDEGKKDAVEAENTDEGKKDGGDDGAAPAEAEAEANTSAEGEAAAGSSESGPEPESEPELVVTRTKKFRELVVGVEVVYCGSGASLMEAEEAEAKMAQQDRLIKETEDARNDLETYVYSMRDAIGMALKDYVSEEENTSYGALLAAEEEWLYTDEGYDGVKKTFLERLAKLQDEGKKFKQREVEFNGREASIAKLVATIKKYKDIVTNANTADTEKYDHLSDEQRSEVVKKCDEAMAWLDAKKTEQAGLLKSANPVLTLAAMKEQRQAVKLVCSPIVNTPKPKPAVPEPKEGEAGAEKEGEEPKAPQAGAPAAGSKDGEGGEGGKDGDVGAEEEGEKADEGKKDGAAVE